MIHHFKKAIIYSGIICFMNACSDKPEARSTRQMLDSIQHLNIMVDSLQKTNLTGGGEMDYWQQPGKNHRLLKSQGIQEVKLHLLKSLSERTDLIPIKPVLGGQFRMNRISLFGDHWAIAAFEDGHIGGMLLLSYSVQSQKVNWKRLDWYSND